MSSDHDETVQGESASEKQQVGGDSHSAIRVNGMNLAVEDLYDKDKYDLSTMDTSDVFTLLQTTPKGLTSQEVEARIAKFGRNKLERKKINPIIQFLSFMWNPLSWAPLTLQEKPAGEAGIASGEYEPVAARVPSVQPTRRSSLGSGIERTATMQSYYAPHFALYQPSPMHTFANKLRQGKSLFTAKGKRLTMDQNELRRFSSVQTAHASRVLGGQAVPATTGGGDYRLARTTSV
ncbi:hypothetical protein H4R35_006290 [Dimargaris xerosporica]|nr:hypothetical protein H4R35_006290 [Dimargaris xerosporica]